MRSAVAEAAVCCGCCCCCGCGCCPCSCWSNRHTPCMCPARHCLSCQGLLWVIGQGWRISMPIVLLTANSGLYACLNRQRMLSPRRLGPFPPSRHLPNPQALRGPNPPGVYGSWLFKRQHAQARDGRVTHLPTRQQSSKEPHCTLGGHATGHAMMV